MIDVIRKYRNLMQTQKSESADMGLRYDGAVQVLDLILNEVCVPAPTYPEIPDGRSDPVTPPEEACTAHTASRPARAKKVPTAKRRRDVAGDPTAK